EKDVEAGHGLAKGSTDGIRIQEVEGFREPVAAAALAFEPEAEIPEATDALPDGRAADSETARQFLAGMETAVGQLPEDRAVRIHGARGLLLLRLVAAGDVEELFVGALVSGSAAPIPILTAGQQRLVLRIIGCGRAET